MQFFKTGLDVHKAMEKDDLERATRFQPFRFFMERGTEKRMTFIDGKLEGGLLFPGIAFPEHMIKRVSGKGFDNYCCTQEQEDCPICLSGDRPSLVFAMTIIDHSEWKDKEGKLHTHQRRLYVCKGDTFKLLQLKAKRPEINGLAGTMWDVARIGEKSAGVGTSYDFVGKYTPAEIMEGTGLKAEQIEPLNYAEVITYMTADELRKIGFGVKNAVGHADIKSIPTEQKAAVGGSPFGKAFNPAKEL